MKTMARTRIATARIAFLAAVMSAGPVRGQDPVVKDFVKADDSVSGLCFSPDGKLLATGTHNAHIQLWDLATGKEVWKRTMPNENMRVTSVAFSPDGRYVAASLMGGSATLIDVAGKAKPVTGKTHETHATGIEFLANDRFATAGYDAAVRVWKIGKANEGVSPLIQCEPGKVLRPDGGGAYVFDLHPKGTRAAAAHHDHLVRVWDLARGGAPIQRLDHGNPVFAVAYAPDGRSLASADSAGKIRIFSEDGKEIRQLPFRAVRLAFGPRPKTLFALDSRAIRRLDLETGKEVWHVEGGDRPAPVYRSLALSENADVIAVGLSNGAVRLLDAATGQPRAPK